MIINSNNYALEIINMLEPRELDAPTLKHRAVCVNASSMTKVA